MEFSAHPRWNCIRLGNQFSAGDEILNRPHEKIHLCTELCQISKMQYFAKIINGLKP